MNVYTVHFTGHYPVGAVATVAAPTKEEALAVFIEHIKKEEPYLVDDNARDLTVDSFVKLPAYSKTSWAIIHLNGNY